VSKPCLHGADVYSLAQVMSGEAMSAMPHAA
jgi:hypothetical protein